MVKKLVKGRAKGARADMPFPEVPRVIYRQNPIEMVICQLRFPTILRIQAELPSQFQELVRGIYPFYQPKPLMPLPLGLPPELTRVLWQGLPLGEGQKCHEFTNKDKTWTISLDRESLALTCHRYERWEQFKEFLAPPLAALRQLYSPPFFVRIGLRYRDRIRQSELSLTDVPWNELLQPWIAGPFESPDVVNDIERTAHQISMRLAVPKGHVLVNHGLAQDASTQEWCYVLDSDFFYEEQTEDAIDILDSLNLEARRFFRWCIKERLHESMHPEPIQAS